MKRILFYSIVVIFLDSCSQTQDYIDPNIAISVQTHLSVEKTALTISWTDLGKVAPKISYTVLIRKYGNISNFDTLVKNYKGISVKNIAVIPNTAVDGRVIGADDKGRHFSANFKLNIGAVTVLNKDQLAIQDVAFERYLIDRKIDSDNQLNGILLKEDALNVEVLDFKNGPIRFTDYYPTNLKGLEYFKNLKTLNVSTAFMDSLDISKNEKLEIVNCSGINEAGVYFSNLRSLNISNSYRLLVLNCSDTKLSSMNFSSCTSLKRLICTNTYLTELNLIYSPDLELINSHGTDLLNVDFSKNSKLKFLDCSAANFGKSLKSIDLSSNRELTELYLLNQNLNSPLDLCMNRKMIICKTDFSFISIIYIPFDIEDRRLLGWSKSSNTIFKTCF